MISPDTIDRAVEAFIGDDKADIATICEAVDNLGDLLNSNVVKVVTSEFGYALYFSRAPMPFPRVAAIRHCGDSKETLEAEPQLMSIFRKHTGLYVYAREYLLRFTKMPQSKLEKIEMLEQLRALENGAKIRVVEVDEKSIGVDTEDDLEQVRSLIAGG